VKKFILNSLCMKVSVVCLVIIWIQEFNWRYKPLCLFVLKSLYCITNESKIPHQKAGHYVQFLSLLYISPHKNTIERDF
jgi:hypothetical protein